MKSTRSKYYKKKRIREKRAFSVLTLLFLLVQTILTPATQYVSANSASVGLSFDKPSVLEGEVLTATLTDSGENSGTLTFSVPTGLSIKEITEGQDHIDISEQDAQSLSFTWKEESEKVAKVEVSAEEAGTYLPQLTSQNGGTQSVAIQVTAQEEVTTEPETEEATESTTDETEEGATEDTSEEVSEETPKVTAEEEAANELEEQAQEEEQNTENEQDSNTAEVDKKALSRDISKVPFSPGENSTSTANLTAPGAIRLPITIRDFNADGILFEMDSVNAIKKDLVNNQLGDNKKPEYTDEMIKYTRSMMYAEDDSISDDEIRTQLKQLFNASGSDRVLNTTLPLQEQKDENGNITYVYNSGAFFPIDDQLLGNEDRYHNYHFSLEMHTYFTYKKGQEFHFSGDDDVWVFINGELALDLGGLHTEEQGTIDLDTLGLEEGKYYSFDFFYMERHTSKSNLKITTSIDFPHIEVEKKAKETAKEGEILDYAVTATNTSKTEGKDLVFTDVLHEGLEFKGQVRINNKKVPREKVEYDKESRTLTVKIGDLSMGESKIISFKAQVKEEITVDEGQTSYIIPNTAQIVQKIDEQNTKTYTSNETRTIVTGTLNLNKKVEVDGSVPSEVDFSKFDFILIDPTTKEEKTISLNEEGRYSVDLKPGTYYIFEKDASGVYGENYSYSVTANGEPATQATTENRLLESYTNGYYGEVTIKSGQEASVKFTNAYQIKVSDITITKEVHGVQEDDLKNGEFEFVLCDEEGTPIGGSKILNMSEGQTLTFSGVKPGKYTIVERNPNKVYDGYKFEKVTVDGHTLQGDAKKGYQSGVITISKGENQEIKFVNHYEPVGSLKIIKVDRDDIDVTLSGVEFELTKKEDKSFSVREKTDEEGIINFKSLEYGTYVLTELATIDGYLLPQDNVVLKEVKINKPGQVITKVIGNTKEKPSIQVEKLANDTEYKNGDTIQYTILVTNNGNVDLNEVTLTDVFSKNGDDTIDQLKLEGYTEPFKLTVGETKEITASYTVPDTDKGGTMYKNVVEVTDPTGAKDKDEVTVTVKEEPNLLVEKTADKAQYKQGETVHYTITVINNGNVDLKRISLEGIFSRNGDTSVEQLKLEGYTGPINLKAGEKATFTATYVIPETDLADTTYTNIIIATVDGMDPIRDEVTITVDPTYAFEVKKTADKEEVKVGETVTYTIDVTNTGNKVLTDVNVFDEMVDLDEVIDQLDVDETKTFTVKHQATAENVGELTNVAVAKVVIDGEELVKEGSVTVKVSEQDAPVVAPEEKPTILDTVVQGVNKFIENPTTGQTTLNILLVLAIFLIAGSGLYVWKRKQ